MNENLSQVLSVLNHTTVGEHRRINLQLPSICSSLPGFYARLVAVGAIWVALKKHLLAGWTAALHKNTPQIQI